MDIFNKTINKLFAAATISVAAVTALCSSLCSCREIHLDKGTPVRHCQSFDIWPDSIDFHSGFILRAVGDSMMQVRVEGATIRTVKAGRPGIEAFRFSSGLPLLDVLYNLEAASPMPSRYSSATPYEAYLCPLQPDSILPLLEKRVKNDYIIPFEARNYSWPVVAGNAQWLMGASQLAAFNGDKDLSRRLGKIARNVVPQERALTLNEPTSLLGGSPRYLLSPSSQFPRWMEPVDILESISLTTNVCHYAALKTLTDIGAVEPGGLGVSPDTLRRDINNNFWIPNLGYYSGLLYGSPLYPVQLLSTDNVGQSLAIISGAASTAMAQSVARKTSVTETGATLTSPLWGNHRADAFPETLLCALWCAATAASGDETAYDNAVGALLYRVCHNLLFKKNDGNPEFSRPVTSLILRGLLGMRFAADGIFFTPYVPAALPGEKQITGLRYRNSVLDIHVSGQGRSIASFTLDGLPSDPFFPADSTGNHEIDIVLTDTPPSKEIRIVEEIPTLPAPPDVSWPSPREAVISASPSTEGSPYMVQLNGSMTEQVYREHYTLYKSETPVVVQFSPYVDNQLLGFSGKPHTYVPDDCRTIIYASSITRTGTRILSDRTIAARYVETNKWKNRSLAFDFNAPDSATYAFEVHYNNGMGIVNPQRRTALRALYIDSSRKGVFVFPQLSAAWWDKDSGKDWQTQSAWSNTLTATLPKGSHRIAVNFYQPSPVYIDPLTNTLLVDIIRITRID